MIRKNMKTMVYAVYGSVYSVASSQRSYEATNWASSDDGLEHHLFQMGFFLLLL